MEGKTILGKEIFSVGIWNGDEYTKEDLENIVKAFEETKTKYRPYLKLGHAENQKLLQKEGLPAAGWIDNLRVVGKKLVADFIDMPDKIYKLIKEKAYRYVSSEIFWNLKFEEKKYDKLLAGVALLGAEMPAVTNLNDFINLYKLDAKFIKTYTLKENEDTQMTNETETKETVVEKKEEIIPEAIVEKVEEKKEEIVEKKEEVVEKKEEFALPGMPQAAPQAPIQPPAQPQPQQKPQPDLAARIAQLEAQVQQLMQQLQGANKQVQKFQEETELKEIELFISENKIAPAAQEYVKQLIGEDKKEYSIKENKYTKANLISEIIKIYSAASVNLVESSDTGNAVNISVDDEEKLIAEVKEYSQKNKMSFRDSFLKVSADKNAEKCNDVNNEE